MIALVRKAFRAQLSDRGFSGEYRKPQFLGYFVHEDDARSVAEEAVVEGVAASVDEEDIDIQIYESVQEYHDSLEYSDVQAAISKLTPEELKALSRKILRDHITVTEV